MANLPALTPTTFAEAMQFADALAKSTMVPPAFQRNPSNILVAIQWGAELGLGPLQALQNIAVIQGKPAVYGDAMLALVRGSPLCEDVIERIEGEGDNRAAVCEARRKGSAPVFGRFSVADAKRAGLWGKTGPWQQYPLRMLQMRARGFALRDGFPDVLRGVIGAEEAADYPREAKDVTPVSAAVLAAELDAFADVEPDQADTDDLLTLARNWAVQGYDDFRRWYLMDLDDDQRTLLRPHVKALQDTARQQDSGAEPDPPAPEPPEGSVFPPTAPPGEAPRRRTRRKPEAEPTEAEIAQSQDAIEAEPDHQNTVVFVPYSPSSSIQGWFAAGRQKLRDMETAEMTGDRFTAYRKANFGALLRLQHEYNSYWVELDELIRAGENRR